MLIAGIVGHDENLKTIHLINSILSTSGKKVAVIGSNDLAESDNVYLITYLNELEKNNTDMLIIKINIQDVEKEIFNFLHFDIMIFSDKADYIKEVNNTNYIDLMHRIFLLLDEKGIAIVNVDDSELIKFLQGMKYHTITYGFNSKASITTSSIGDNLFKDNFLCCLQRTISARNGILVEPQEYRIRVAPNEFDAYNVLAAATFAIVNGIDLNLINFEGS